MKQSKLLFLFALAFAIAPSAFAQKSLEGLWQGYDGEGRHVSEQRGSLAEAPPAEKSAWRPAPGVRSTSEVYMHIATANFYLLSVTGPKMPADLKDDDEMKAPPQTTVLSWFRRPLA